MNERSSRAHSLFILTLDQRHRAADVRVRSQLFLADLGGSEQVKRSKVNEGGGMTAHVGHVMGARMREAVYINLGLLALKKCIEALNRKYDYVPYQDSKLTMLLSSGLGGDSNTVVMICASMDESDAPETFQALRFGEKCRHVATEATMKQSVVASTIDALEQEIRALEAAIKAKETWQTNEVIRKDALAEEGTVEAMAGGKEIVRTTQLVGAEKERKRLEEVILQLSELTGEDMSLEATQAAFSNQFGATATQLGGNATTRFQTTSKKGLVVKGRKVAEWKD